MASAEAGQPAPYRRDDAGKFANTAAEPDAPGAKPAAPSPDAAPQFTSLLSHVEMLEKSLREKEEALLQVNKKVDKITTKSRAAMESIVKSLMDRWVSAVQTDDETVKDDCKAQLRGLANKGDDQNGVWQFMVAASALHEQQNHNLDALRQENTDLKSRIDGHYAKPGARLQEDVLGKRKAEQEIDRFDVAADASSNVWQDFASDMSGF